ncbi:preprotein translocase subunit SecE [Desulfovibrio aerotolerans]|uniref:Protein translocase subunit SecE n=1 Tax=Solidesulfovibrio aerotolerans TaxID=295255 RepID=A0A7C9IU94_9BACT|nr:preprotein translocase subunit SecE [Solidesulfovibrio aerotolerans]MYL83300.1 preprotein translocase subunit SecE [Solidesulfovibrio aerotolerans]
MAKDKTQAASVAETPSKPKASRGKSKEEAGKDGISLTGRIDQAKEFFDQAKGELKKVTWPTREETVKTGIAVLVFSVVMAIYLGVVDMALSRLVALILS